MYDLAGNVNSSINRTITIDTTNPNATLVSPANASYFSNLSLNITANLTENLGIKNATVFVYNQSGLFNVTDITNFAVGTVQATVEL